jgi:cation diffusion facilitator family transporter
MSQPQNNTLIKSASYIAIITATIILCAKGYGWIVTNSQSILASLIDSLLDVSSSLISLIAIHVALQPPDHNHRFGHEKFQDLAVFSQSIFFLASGLFTFSSSIRALFNKTYISNHSTGINIMYFCIALTFVLVCYQTYVIKKTNSQIIIVDKLHYFSDSLMNIGIIISVNLSSNFWFIDSLFGIVISLYVIYSSYILFKQVTRNLSDEEFPQEDRQKILNIISNYKSIKGIHELKTRYAARKPFIQFHLEMDGGMPLHEAYKLSKKISEELLSIFPGGEIIIHKQPVDDEEEIKYREEI